MLQMHRRKWLLLLLREFTQQGLFLHRHIFFDVYFLVGVRNVLAFALFITRKSNFVGVGSGVVF